MFNGEGKHKDTRAWVLIYLLSSALNSSAVIDLENMPNVPLVAASWPSWLVAAMQSVMVITLNPFSSMVEQSDDKDQ